MFKIFKRKSKLEKLDIQYRKLLDESYHLRNSNRKESDLKKAEAEHILIQIKSLQDKI